MNMARDNKAFQQRQWIIEDYKSIVEDPESYGFLKIENHMEEVIDDIKEDVDAAFDCSISKEIIIKTIEQWQQL